MNGVLSTLACQIYVHTIHSYLHNVVFQGCYRLSQRIQPVGGRRFLPHLPGHQRRAGVGALPCRPNHRLHDQGEAIQNTTEKARFFY